MKVPKALVKVRCGRGTTRYYRVVAADCPGMQLECQETSGVGSLPRMAATDASSAEARKTFAPDRGNQPRVV